MNENSKLCTITELCDKYGLVTNVVEYLGIITCITKSWKCIGQHTRVSMPFSAKCHGYSMQS